MTLTMLCYSLIGFSVVSGSAGIAVVGFIAKT